MVGFRFGALSFVTEGYAALGEIIGRHLYLHLVAGQDLDVVHAHLA